MALLAVVLIVLTATPSASTLAAVAIFTANADRKWPVDEREPVVTGEVLRLLETAARAMADDWQVNGGKLKDSVARFATARAALERQPRGDAHRPAAARDALASGTEMIDALAAALHCDDPLTRQRLAGLKRSAESLDRHRPVRQQAGVLERFFHDAAALMTAMLDTAPADRPVSALYTISPLRTA